MTRRERGLVVLAVLATPDERHAVVSLQAPYAGLPRASVAMATLRDELVRLGAEAAG